MTKYGKCKYDDHCIYAHTQEELRPKPKWLMCNNVTTMGFCTYGQRVGNTLVGLMGLDYCGKNKAFSRLKSPSPTTTMFRTFSDYQSRDNHNVTSLHT